MEKVTLSKIEKKEAELNVLSRILKDIEFEKNQCEETKERNEKIDEQDEYNKKIILTQKVKLDFIEKLNDILEKLI